MNEHTVDELECWCRPTVELYPNGAYLVIHNEKRIDEMDVMRGILKDIAREERLALRQRVRRRLLE